MDVTDEIKARLDIVDLVSDYVPLKKAGRNYKALCPFHTEKTPSFVVFPESGTWRCFGACNEGGDIFSFVMKAEGWDFGEALRVLAERAGVTLEQRGPSEQTEQYDRLRELLAEATTYYHHLLLNAPVAGPARAYVRRRGLTGDTARAFMLGYAPDSWDAARTHLQAQGYSEQDLIDAGLLIDREDGRRYDRFRNRLMIPIRDSRGRTVGFGARALNPDDNPKYLNSPQSALFDKSRLLFGFDMARRSIRERETAVLVEGYMDVMQARQAGFDNVVAQMGTALTETQLRQLSKYARRLILALDPDVAGVRATMRDLEVAREALSEDTAPTFDARGMIRLGGQLDIDIRILRLPKGKDPDDLIREQPEVWQRLLDEALPVAKYVIEQATQGRDLADAFDREQVARELLPILSATERQLQTQNNLQELARAVRIPERTLIAWANAQRAQPARPRRRPKAEPPPEPEAEPPPAKATAAPLSVSWQERYCMAALLKRQDLIYHIDRCLQALDLPRLSANDFTQAALQAIFRAFQASLAQDAQDPIDYMRATLPAVLVGELDALLQFEPPGHILKSMGHFMQSQPLHSVLLDAKGMADALELLLGLRERLLQRAIEQLYFLQAEAQEDGDLTRAAELGTIVDQHRRDLQRLHKEGILTIRSLSG